MQCPECNVALPSDARFCAACGRSLPGAVGPAAAATGMQPWVVVVIIAAAAVLVVGFLGIVAAIAIPNLLNAIDRGKQKRTIADIRAVGTAIEAYSVDHETYPVAEDLESIRSLLEPMYIRRLPGRDGWNHPIQFASDGTSYELISPGKDGIVQGCGSGPTISFTSDICFADGEFVQWPEGTQR